LENFLFPDVISYERGEYFRVIRPEMGEEHPRVLRPTAGLQPTAAAFFEARRGILRIGLSFAGETYREK